MAGLATATMVPSRPTIITPSATASSVSGGLPRQRRGSPPGLAGRGVRLGRAAGTLVLVMRSPWDESVT